MEFFYSSADASSNLVLTVKHNVLIKDPCVGAVGIKLNALMRLCENDRCRRNIIFSLRDSSELSTDTTLQLNAVDGEVDDICRGFITVRLVPHTINQTSAISALDASEDIELMQYGVAGHIPAQSIDLGIGFTAKNDDFHKALASVVSKLDLFVHIVDKASMVCVLRYSQCTTIV
jgi:hypothetical protein